jgi:hypothetical protein
MLLCSYDVITIMITIAYEFEANHPSSSDRENDYSHRLFTIIYIRTTIYPPRIAT